MERPIDRTCKRCRACLWRVGLTLLLVLLAACSRTTAAPATPTTTAATPAGAETTPTPTSGPTTGAQETEAAPTATPAPSPTPPPKPAAHETAETFLTAWAAGDWQTMYDLCTPDSQATYPYEEFYRIYTEIAQVATIISVEPNLISVLEGETSATAQFTAQFDTSFVGPFRDENALQLEWIGDRWAVNWSKRTVLSQLAEDNRVYMQPQLTARANIYDVLGKGLAFEGAKVTVGVVPGMIEDEAAVLARLTFVLNIPTPEIQAMYEGQPITWFIPIGDITLDESREHYELLTSEPGIELRERPLRTYRTPAAAPHIVGTMGYIPAEQVEAWQALGYSMDAIVGRTGIEAWGEPYLAGSAAAS